jgi:hypothetical protein
MLELLRLYDCKNESSPCLLDIVPTKRRAVLLDRIKNNFSNLILYVSSKTRFVAMYNV